MLARTLESSRSSRRPAATATPSPPERRKLSRTRMTALRPAAPPEAGDFGAAISRLNHEQGRPRAVDRHGERAVGHRELGTGQEAGRGQAIGPERFLIRDDEIDPLEVKRPGAKVEHHDPVRRRAVHDLRGTEPQSRPPCARLGQQLVTARSLDRDRRQIEIGPRGDPESPSPAAEPIEHGDELLGAANHVFIVESRVSARDSSPPDRPFPERPALALHAVVAPCGGKAPASGPAADPAGVACATDAAGTWEASSAGSSGRRLTAPSDGSAAAAATGIGSADRVSFSLLPCSRARASSAPATRCRHRAATARERRHRRVGTAGRSSRS